MTATVTALAAPRALTPPERAKLRAQLKAQLKIATDDDATDAEDLLDYVLEMVEGGKAAGYVAEELSQPPLLPVCGKAEAVKVGETLAAFFAGLETGSKDGEDDAAAALQERLASLKKEKSERLASVQSQRLAFVASLETGKAVVAVEEKKRGAPSPPSLSSMTVAELKEELHVRNNSGYVPSSRIALEAALAAARKKDGADEAPQAAVKESGGGQEEEKAKEEGDIEEAVPTAVGIQQPSIAIKQGSEKAGAKEARLNTGRQVKAWVTKPSQDCFLGIGLTGNDSAIRITSIAQDGLFARTNLEVGQVLGTINGAPCKTATEAVARLREAKGIAIVAYEGVGDIEQGDIEQGVTANASATERKGAPLEIKYDIQGGDEITNRVCDRLNEKLSPLRTRLLGQVLTITLIRCTEGDRCERMCCAEFGMGWIHLDVKWELKDDSGAVLASGASHLSDSGNIGFSDLGDSNYGEHTLLDKLTPELGMKIFNSVSDGTVDPNVTTTPTGRSIFDGGSAVPMGSAVAPPRRKTTSGKATASMWLGIVSIFVFGIILGPVAIVMGISAKKEIEDNPRELEGTSQANTGIACGTVALIIWTILVIIVV